jgi:hypothetical protein
MRSRARSAVCAAVLAVLALPAPAWAEEDLDIARRGLTAAMSVRGSHGYRVLIAGTAGGRVNVVATKDGAAATYDAPGRVTRTGLHANLGQLGRISVRFRRIGRPRVKRPPGSRRCKGRDPILEKGRFEGTIRFHGEQGFTDVAVQAAKGAVVQEFKRRCSPQSDRRGGRAAASHENQDSARALIAGTTEHGRSVYFALLSIEAELDEDEPLVLSLATAGTSERRGRISIQRVAVIPADAGNLLVSPFGVAPATATVSLPRPFAGTASFLGADSPPSWTGSLNVHLPGADVPLTGPGFTAALCHERFAKKFESCVNEATDAIGVADTFARASAGLLP